jgi:hypothetical protein
VDKSAHRKFELIPYAYFKNNFESLPVLIVFNKKLSNLDQNTLLKQIRIANVSQNTPQLIDGNTAYFSVRYVNYCKFLSGTEQKSSLGKQVALPNVPILFHKL